MKSIRFLSLLCLLVLAVSSAAQVTIKRIPAKFVSPTDGKLLYTTYCASCHGPDLNGNPAMARVVTKNINLRTTSSTRMYAQTVHGSDQPGQELSMPSWRRILRRVYSGDQAQTQLAIYNINRYIESRQ